MWILRQRGPVRPQAGDYTDSPECQVLRTFGLSSHPVSDVMAALRLSCVCCFTFGLDPLALSHRYKKHTSHPQTLVYVQTEHTAHIL